MARQSPEAASQHVDNYVSAKALDSDSKTTERLRESANVGIKSNTKSDGTTNDRFNKELQDKNILPQLTVDQYDKIAMADGKAGLTKDDLKKVEESKDSNEFDPMAKLAAKYIGENFKDMAVAGNTLNFGGRWGSGTIDKSEMKAYAREKGIESRKEEAKGDKGRETESVAAKVRDHNDLPEGDQKAHGEKLGQELERGGHLKYGSEKNDKLLAAMKRDGSGAQLVDEQFKGKGDLSRADLQKMAKEGKSMDKLAAQFAIKNFDEMTVAGNNWGGAFGYETLDAGERKEYARLNKKDASSIRPSHKTEDAAKAVNDLGSKLRDANATKQEKDALANDADTKIDKAHVTDSNRSGYGHDQSEAFAHRVRKDNAATIAMEPENFEALGGKDGKITKDEIKTAARGEHQGEKGKKLTELQKGVAVTLREHFDQFSGGDGTIDKSDLQSIKRGDTKFASASVGLESIGKGKDSTSKSLTETVLDKNATGKQKAEAALQLHKKGIKEFKYEMGGKEETAKIDYQKGPNGKPDSLYVWDGKGNPMIRSHVKGDEVYKQHGVEFEGKKWSERSESAEPKLKEVDKFKAEDKVEKKLESAKTTDKSSTEDLAKTILDEDASGKDRMEAAKKLAEKGIKSFQYKINGKVETANIDLQKGKNGTDQLYVWDGRGNPMLRSFVKNGEIKQQGKASFEGSTWKRRMQRSKDHEAALVKIEEKK